MPAAEAVDNTPIAKQLERKDNDPRRSTSFDEARKSADAGREMKTKTTKSKTVSAPKAESRAMFPLLEEWQQIASSFFQDNEVSDDTPLRLSSGGTFKMEF